MKEKFTVINDGKNCYEAMENELFLKFCIVAVNIWDKSKGDCGQWMNYSRKLWIM